MEGQMTTMAVTETLRLCRLIRLNVETADRSTLEQRHGQVWDPAELRRDFTPIGYMAPFVVVRRKADGVLGSLEFQHQPRFYFNWSEDNTKGTYHGTHDSLFTGISGQDGGGGQAGR